MIVSSVPGTCLHKALPPRMLQGTGAVECLVGQKPSQVREVTD